jgi:hypothetical protein
MSESDSLPLLDEPEVEELPVEEPDEQLQLLPQLVQLDELELELLDSTRFLFLTTGRPFLWDAFWPSLGGTGLRTLSFLSVGVGKRLGR